MYKRGARAEEHPMRMQLRDALDYEERPGASIERLPGVCLDEELRVRLEDAPRALLLD